MNRRRFLLAGFVTLLTAGVSTIGASPSTPREAAAYSPPGYTASIPALSATVSKAGVDTVGLVDPGTGRWRLRNELGGVATFYYGNPGDYPIVGDWDCDGVDTPGLYRQSDGYVYLRNENTQGNADIRFFFGNPGDIPIAGDFNGNGCDTVSIYRPSEGRVFIINELGNNDGGLGAADLSYYFGNPGDIPFVGDFNGNGTETIGLYRETSGFVYFRLTHTQGKADNSFYFGDPGDRFVAGDWTGNGVDTPGVFRPRNTTFYFRHSNTQGNADAQFRWGSRPWLPVAGTFNLPDDLPVPPPPPPPPGPGFQPAAPIRAAFIYPWFPQAWKQGGVFPFTRYTPSLGYYDSSDAATIDQQVSLAKRAGIEAFISSWWGPGHHTDTALGAILDRVPDSPYPAMRLAVYYEEEGQSDPSPARIVSDLEYLAQSTFSDPSYLRVDGKPVIFVWADAGDGPGMAKRWKQAKAAFGGDLFVVLKVYSGYRSDPNQPDSWHQYGPASAYHEQLPYSATVSPGFWHIKEGSARLPRDPARFRSDVKRMVGSGAFWQLVTTWNEWGEGTSVEPAGEFGTTYIDILADEVPPPPSPPPAGSVRFTVAGDIGANSRADKVLAAMAAENASFNLTVGDLSYSERKPESAWCGYVKGLMGATYPIEILSGNHEDDNGPDGFIRNFTPCLPDRMGSIGDYGVEYYFDAGPVRVIMIAADSPVDGEQYDYNSGPHRDWLRARIAESEAAGRWTVVGMHKNCITAGVKGCSVGEAMIDDIIARGVDLIVQGHEHNYQRSHQLRCVDAGRTTSACIVDTDSVFTAEAGAVLAIAGWVGRSGYDVDRGDSEAGYFAVIEGPNTSGFSNGYLTITASATELSGVWKSVGAAGTDAFTIRR